MKIEDIEVTAKVLTAQKGDIVFIRVVDHYPQAHHAAVVADLRRLNATLGIEVVLLPMFLDVVPTEPVWVCFHKAWTAAVGTPDYDKEVWKKAEAQLLRAGFGHVGGPRGELSNNSSEMYYECARCLAVVHHASPTVGDGEIHRENDCGGKWVWRNALGKKPFHDREDDSNG